MLSSQCENGHRVQAPDRLAGKTAKCPKCGSPITFPNTEVVEEEIVDEEGDDLDDAINHLEAQQRQNEEKREAQKQKRKLERTAQKKTLKQVEAKQAAASNRMILIGGISGLVLLLGLVSGVVLYLRSRPAQRDIASNNAVPISPVQNSTEPIPNEKADSPAIASRGEPNEKTANQVSASVPAVNAGVSQSSEADAEVTSVSRQLEFPSFKYVAAERKNEEGSAPKGGEVKLIETALLHAFHAGSGQFILKQTVNNFVRWFLCTPDCFDGNPDAVREIGPSEEIATIGFKSWKDKVCLVICTIPKTEGGKSALLAIVDSKNCEPLPQEKGFVNPIAIGEQTIKSTSTSVLNHDPLIMIDSGKLGSIVNIRNGSIWSFEGGNDSNCQISRTGRYVNNKYTRWLLTKRHLPKGWGDFKTKGTDSARTQADPWDQIFVATDQTGIIAGIRALGSDFPANTAFPVGVNFKCYMQERPWLIGVDKDQLCVLSRETAQVVASRKISMADVRSVVDDAAHERLLVFGKDSALVVPYRDIEFPDSDALVARIDLPARVEPLKKITAMIESPTPDLKVSLVSGPPSAEIVDGQLEWLPSVDQIGIQTFKLRYELGVDVKDEVLECIVSRLPLPLQFEPEQYRISPDQRYVVAWGDKQGPSGPKPPRVVVYDMVQKKTTLSAEMDLVIIDVAVTNFHVMMLTGESERETFASRINFPNPRDKSANARVIRVYSLPELRLQSSHAVPVGISQMLPLGGKSLLIGDGHVTPAFASPKWNSPVSNCIAVSVPEMTPKPWSHMLPHLDFTGVHQQVRRDDEGRWFLGEFTLDPGGDTILNTTIFFPHLLTYANVPESGVGMKVEGIRPGAPIPIFPQVAGRFGSGFTRWAKPPNSPTSERLGATCSLVLIEKGIDKVHFQPDENTPQFKIAWSPTNQVGNNNPIPITICKHGILCLGDGLHLLPLSVLDNIPQGDSYLSPADSRDRKKEKATTASKPPGSDRPLTIHAIPKQFVIEPGGTLGFEVSGGVKPYRIEYLPAAAFSPVTFTPVGQEGNVKLNFSKSASTIAQSLIEFFTNRLEFKDLPTSKALSEFRSGIHENYGKGLGIELPEVPFPFYMSITATDAAGTKVTLNHGVFLSIAQKEIEKTIEVLKKRIK